ncbi:MAG: hypothetical protein ABSH48_13485 [Verrucomicrobiota bacterium]|jgi:hypothetical protein
MKVQNSTPVAAAENADLPDPAREHLLFERSAAESWSFPRVHCTDLAADETTHVLQLRFPLFLVSVTTGSASQAAQLSEAIAAGQCYTFQTPSAAAPRQQIGFNILHPKAANDWPKPQAVKVKDIKVELDPDLRDSLRDSLANQPLGIEAKKD